MLPKKIVFFLIFLIGFHGSSFACDVCGCGNGGSFYGLLPQSHTSLFGIRYRVKTFDSHVLSTFDLAREQFMTSELYARFYPMKKLQLMAFLPVHANVQTRQLDQSKHQIQGLGDASLIFHYAVLNTLIDTVVQTWDHVILLGAGVKAPIGKYRFEEGRGGVANANFQLGTGSWDFPISVNYTIRKGQTGLNVDFSHRFTTFNTQHYRFANRQLLAVTAFHQSYLGKISWIPNGGFAAEHANQDVQQGIRNGYTGAQLLQGTLGSEFYFGRWAIGATGYVPIYQNLAGGELQIRSNWQAHVTLNF